MIADATGLPIDLSESLEASSLGAAMSAAVGLGWFADFGEAAETMSRTGATVMPNRSARAAWDALSIRQAATYRATLLER